MAEAFLSLSDADRADAIGVAATASGRPAHVLEKDVWVVWLLDAIFSGPGGDHLVFKGGTSLSKAYGVIDRFSEDIDLTYDIRALVAVPDKAAVVGDEPLPASGAQGRSWRAMTEAALDDWIGTEVVPSLTARLEREGLTAAIDPGPQRLTLTPGAVSQGWDYVQPGVLMEFGGRSTGLPAEPIDIVCDAAAYLPDLVLPTARPRVMAAERTFWEKATAVHVFNHQEALKSDRLSRHWYDLWRLDETGHAARALEQRDLAEQVAAHKSAFYPVTGVDYRAAVNGGLRLVPSDAFLEQVRDDYGRMQDGGLLNADAVTFDALIARCTDLQDRLNAACAG